MLSILIRTSMATAMVVLGPMVASAQFTILDGTRVIQNIDGIVSSRSTKIGNTGTLKTITIRNSGTTPASLSQYASVSPLSDFSIANNVTLNQQIAPGASTTITIRLTGSAMGYKAGTVNVAGNKFKLFGAVTDGGIVLDNLDPGFSSTGSWFQSPGYGGHLMRASGSGTPNATASANWIFTDIPPGKYHVAATWFGHAGLTGSAKYTIRDGVGGVILATPSVNQQYQSTGMDGIVGGQPFQRIATVTITGNVLSVQVTNAGFFNSSSVAADAMQIIPAQ